MADIQSNIDINIDTTNALANIKNLQRQISLFHQGLRASGSAANAAISENMSRNLVNSINATKKFGASFTTVQSATQAFTTSLEKNKLSMGQYFKYAAGSTKTFGRLFTTEFNTIEHVAKSRVKTLQTQFIKLGRDANGAVKAIRVRPLTLDMKDLATQTAINAQKQQIFNQLIKQGSTNLLNFGKNTQWAGRQLMVGFTVPLAYLGTTAARVFMDMEKQVIKLRRVYGDFATTAGETEAMVSQIKQLGDEFTKYGVAASKTMGLAADAAAMGKQGADLVAQVSEANRLAILGGVEQAQALETTISVTNAFGVAAEDLAGKINFLNAVENQSVTAIEDLTIAIPKAGPVIKQLGGSVEDLAFFLTAMKEGGINASEGANALKSGLASIINPSQKASEFMDGFGISIKGIVDANKGNVRGIILGMADALNTLDPLNRARAIEQMFGKFQFARISTLFQNVRKEGSQAQTVLGLTKSTAEELAILSERELKKVEDSPMFKFQKAIEDIKVSLIPLGEQFLKLVTPIIEFGTRALEQFNKLDSGVKNFIMSAVGVLGGLAPAAIMAFGLIANGIANLIKTGNFLRNIFVNAGQGTQILGQQTQYMTNEQLEAAASAASLDQAHQKLTQQFTVEATAVRKLADAYNAAAIAGAKLTAAGAVGRTGKGGGKAKGYNSGVLSVPGPKGAGDIVPAMLAPGEAVIPADKAKKYRGFIADMMQDKLPGFKKSNIEVSRSGSTIDVGGVTYKLPKNIDARQMQQLQTEANRLHSYDPKASATAMTILENVKGFTPSSNPLRSFRETAVYVLDIEKGLGLGQAAQIIMPSKLPGATPEQNKLMAAENQLFRKKIRGVDKTKMPDSITEFVKKNPARQREFDIARNMSQAMFREALAMGMSEKDAAAKVGWDPDPKKNQLGVERAHKEEVGVLKMFKEMWKSPFIALDTRMENGLFSTLSRSSDQAKVFTNAIDDLIGKEKDDVVKESLKSLRSKIDSNGVLDESERRAFARTIDHLEKNKTKYLGSNKSFATLGGIIRLLDKGYKSVDISGNYRAPTEDSRKMVREFNQGKKTIIESAKQIAASKGNPYLSTATATKTEPRRMQMRRYAKGVVSVPGPKGAGDVVPAMLSPGEAVIPAGMAKKYGPLIAGMVTDTLPGYAGGLIAGLAGRAASAGASLKGMASAGKEMAKGFLTTTLPAGAQLGKNFIQNAGPGIKNAISNIGPGIIKAADRIDNSRFGQSRIGQWAGNKIMDRMTESPEQKQARKERSRARSGRMAQGAMGLSFAMGALSMAPGTVGQVAQAAMGPIAGMTAAMSLIPGPAGIAVGALAATGIAILQVKDNFEKFRAEAGKTALAVSSGRNAMQSLSEFAGTVSSSEAMDRIRRGESSPYNIQTGKNTFGGTFLQSADGAELISGIRKTRAFGGSNTAVSDVATQLSQAVAGNILTKEQAASIAYNLGSELKDYKFSANVLGKMTQILGPNGEDITKNPLQVSARIIQEKQTSLGSAEEQGSVKGLISGSEYAMGGFGMAFNARANSTEVAAAEQKQAQGFQDILEMGQQNLDNLELAHRTRVAELTAAGKLGEVEKANGKFIQDRTKVQQANAKAIQTEYDYISDLENSSGGLQQASARQIVDNIEASRKLLFADMEEDVKSAANQLIEKVANEGQLSLADRATLTASISVENIDEYQQLQALFPISQKSDVWQKIANVSVKYGSGVQQKLISLGGFFGESETEKKTYEAFVNFTSTDANGQQIIDNLTEITRVTEQLTGEPIKMSELIDTDTGKPTEKLKNINWGIKKVSEAIAKNKGKKINYDVVANVKGFNLAQEQIDYFNSLPADQQKVYTTTFLTVQETISDEQINALRQEKINTAGSNRAKEYYSALPASELARLKAADDAYKATQALTTEDVKTGDGEDGDTTGGTGTNPLDALLKRLKEIRQAAVNANGGMTELFKWMKSGALANADGSPVFSGIEQQLSGKGYNKDFIDFITSQEAAVREKYVSIGKNGIVTVKKEGVALQKLFNALSLGEYERSVKSAVDASQQELNARRELLKNQMPYADAIEAARDSTFAQNLLIAKSIENEKERAAAIKKVIDLYKEQKKAVEDVRTEEEQFNDLSAKISKKFDADKNKIGIDFELRTSGDKGVVAAAQQQIAEVRNQLDDYNAGLTRLEPVEEGINKKYDDRIASLENIRDLNDRIAEQKDAELDISAALARGDVSAAAAAIQKEQQRQAQEAMDAKIKNLEKQREAEVNSLTTRVQVNGQTLMLTKEQINKRIKDLETQIFNIEEDRLEPAQTRIELATYERDLKLKALDDEKLKWDELKNKIDLAATASLSYAETLKEAIRLSEIAAGNYANPVASEEPTSSVGRGGSGRYAVAYTMYAKGGMVTGYANGGMVVPSPEPPPKMMAKGGMVSPSYFGMGGFARGTDTVPAMLTPGEFIMSKYAVDTYGTDAMKAMNSGELSGGSVYNSYAVSVNVRSDANPDQIARAVMGQIKQVNSQQLRGNRF